MSEDMERDVREAAEALNRCWLEGRVEELRDHLAPGVVQVLPEFTGRIEGLDGVIRGYRDFVTECRIHAFATRDWQVDLRPDVAIVAYAFDLVYERGGVRSRAKGRDLWVMGRREGDGRWVGEWRTMLEVEEERIP